ncbi:RlmE family RNA methyltransferase [Pseudenhygromyxa sp. WMMC2535]|uniref:RlmE family RNA methyltransferase n=1 Tax=Pseudenhygromyxa sp. WMMC2535 TaxID=2712867 RepID=UPI001553F511|nr:RlmE family RNA methyltransferase [Pseudenhygromyxa sp. WMMC2535]NVB41128.1 RlmE family RNA methyltransferase [Pseudenhygromyxa sp. WMMC2535]
MARKGLGDKRNRHDPDYLRAKRENYAGRAIYKLQEIDQRFRLIKPGMRVLDLGCWPGSWLQYAAEKAGPEASLIGVDLAEVEIALPSTVQTFVGDVYKLKLDRMRERFGPFDLVISDMAPNTTGNKDYDIPASEDLLLRALEIATATLRTGGHFCAKVFQGGRFPELIRAVEQTFQQGRAYRCKHTRKQSREQYIVGRGLRASIVQAREQSSAQHPHADASEPSEG